MEAATDAWNSMSYLEGFLFTLWIVALYWGKKRIDLHFDRKMYRRSSTNKVATSSTSTIKNPVKKSKWF